MLEKQKNVLVAMPFCDVGKVEIWAAKKDALSEKKTRKIVDKDKAFTLTAFAVQADKTTKKTRRETKRGL